MHVKNLVRACPASGSLTPIICGSKKPRDSDRTIESDARELGLRFKLAQTRQCPDPTSDRQFAGRPLSWSYRPYPAPVLARSHGMSDTSRRSHHRVDRAFEGNPFGRQPTHFVVCTHLRADHGAGGDEVTAHVGDRSRNRSHPRTSSRRTGRGAPDCQSETDARSRPDQRTSSTSFPRT
jgi:hypothetical protein